MALRRPLTIDIDGNIRRIDPTLDELEAQIDASRILNFVEYAQDAVASSLTNSNTIVWSYLESSNIIQAEVKSFSITDEHIASNASIAWSKISKVGSSLSDIQTRDHNLLLNVQGGNSSEQYHLTLDQHSTLTTGLEASGLHNHNTLYYQKIELQTAGQANVHWDNVTNKPATYPPEPHTHTSSDITDFVQAAMDAAANALLDTDSIDFNYNGTNITADVKCQDSASITFTIDVNGLKADLKVSDTNTIDLEVSDAGLTATIKTGSIINDHISTAAAIDWSKISKLGSKLEDLDNVVSGAIDGQGLIYSSATASWQPGNILSDAHQTAIPIDHPDGSITESKLADRAVSARTLSLNIDASSIGFNADKVDGKDVNDLATDDSALWTAQRIINFVNSQVSHISTYLDPVLDKDLCTPPDSPNIGDRYLVCVSGTATGSWTGYENNVAEWDGTTWVFTAPAEGMMVWVEDENAYYIYDGYQWKLWAANINHETLAGLQGGQPGEHYHLDSSQHTNLTAGNNADSLHKHSKLSDATGNDALVVDATYIKVNPGYKLTDIPDPVDPEDAVNLGYINNLQHNSLQGLQGGDGTNYYHLTQNEWEANATKRELVFDGLTPVTDGVSYYLKTRFPMLANKAFVQVYADGVLMDPANWDFDLGVNKLSRLSDITDTLKLNVTGASTYKIVYTEFSSGFVPKLGLTRSDGSAFTLSRIHYLIHDSATLADYYLDSLTSQSSLFSYSCVYRKVVDPNVTKTITKLFPDSIYLLDMPINADLGDWRLEVWRSSRANRRKVSAVSVVGVPRIASASNLVAFSLERRPQGNYRVLLRNTAKNIVTQFSQHNVVVRRVSVLSNDEARYVGRYYYLDLR